VSERESLEEQAAMEGYVPEYEPDEEPADDFPGIPDPYDSEYFYEPEEDGK